MSKQEETKDWLKEKEQYANERYAHYRSLGMPESRARSLAVKDLRIEIGKEILGPYEEWAKKQKEENHELETEN